jgi:hypothetical protein
MSRPRIELVARRRTQRLSNVTLREHCRVVENVATNSGVVAGSMRDLKRHGRDRLGRPGDRRIRRTHARFSRSHEAAAPGRDDDWRRLVRSAARPSCRFRRLVRPGPHPDPCATKGLDRRASFRLVAGEPEPINRLALHYLADAAALDPPKRQRARETTWRRRLGSTGVRTSSVFKGRGKKPRAECKREG